MANKKALKAKCEHGLPRLVPGPHAAKLERILLCLGLSQAEVGLQVIHSILGHNSRAGQTKQRQ